MDEARKNIVLREIKYWKEHRLLPEHYCDFLITLYTEGSETGQEGTENKTFTFKNLIFQLMNVFIISLLMLTFVVIYFTELSIDLQIGLFIISVSISLCGAIFFYKKNHSLFFSYGTYNWHIDSIFRFGTYCFYPLYGYTNWVNIDDLT